MQTNEDQKLFHIQTFNPSVHPACFAVAVKKHFFFHCILFLQEIDRLTPSIVHG